MARRQPDKLEIVTDSGTFNCFSRLSVTNDLLGQAEATFETGDEASWPDIERLMAHGTRAVVQLNSRPRLKGRVEVLEANATADGGVSALITVRTKMADARYSSALPRTITNDMTFKQFLLKLYDQIGLGEADFNFKTLSDVSVLTGKEKGGGKITDFEKCKPQQAKVNPPETIFAAADRHLRRFRALHWDGADGRIVVGEPNDTQAPTYVFNCRTGSGASQANNVMGVRRVRDWSECAREVWVLGTSSGQSDVRKSIKGSAIDDELDAVSLKAGQNFKRLVLIPQQQAEDALTAAQHAKRELTARRQRKDGWEITVDGWTYWNGSEQVPYAPDTTCDVRVDPLGGSKGAHLIVRVAMDYSTDSGCSTRLTTVAKGLFTLG